MEVKHQIPPLRKKRPSSTSTWKGTIHFPENFHGWNTMFQKVCFKWSSGFQMYTWLNTVNTKRIHFPGRNPSFPGTKRRPNIPPGALPAKVAIASGSYCWHLVQALDQNDGWNLKRQFSGRKFLNFTDIHIHVFLDINISYLHVRDEVAFFKSVINMYPSM